MLNLDLIRDNEKEVKKKLATRGVSEEEINKIIDFDKKKRNLIQEVEDKRHKLNKLSEEIAHSKPTEEKIEKGRELKKEIKKIEDSLDEIKEKFAEKLALIPNVPRDEVPVGDNEEDNEVLDKVGSPPKKEATPQSYLEIVKNLDLIDTSRAAKVAGSRFTYIKKELVLLELALVNFTLFELMKEGFTPVMPPMMMKEGLMRELGYENLIQNEDLYYLPKDKLNLVGTAEHTIGAMYKNEILDSDSLPQRIAGFSTCFRREAGSYGKDTKGILRLHQFNKVEMFSFVKPEKAIDEHRLFVKIARQIVEKLELPYRLVRLCTGDLGQPATVTYDLETWIPSQERYRETHSISHCSDYQSRGLKIRYRDHDQETRYLHTVNGTAIALERMLIAIIENYQTKEGGIKIPKVLQNYLPFKEIN